MAAQTTAAGGDLPSRIAALAESVVEDAEIELVDVEVKGSRGSQIVRLTVDADGGVDVDRIAGLSRRFGGLLDEHDLIESGYTLEVTSPGADRPLRQPRDFARNRGRDVTVIRNANRPEGEPGEVTGTVVGTTDAGVTLEVDGEPVELSVEEIEHGKVVLPW